MDGAEIPVNVIYANKMYEQAKHMSLTRHTYTPTPFIANVGFLQKLTGDDQRLVVQAARDASVAQRVGIDQRTNEFIDLLKKQGMQVTEVDTAAFRPRPPPSTRSLRRGSARTCSTRCCEASDAQPEVRQEIGARVAVEQPFRARRFPRWRNGRGRARLSAAWPSDRRVTGELD